MANQCEFSVKKQILIQYIKCVALSLTRKRRKVKAWNRHKQLQTKSQIRELQIQLTPKEIQHQILRSPVTLQGMPYSLITYQKRLMRWYYPCCLISSMISGKFNWYRRGTALHLYNLKMIGRQMSCRRRFAMVGLRSRHPMSQRLPMPKNNIWNSQFERTRCYSWCLFCWHLI